MPGHGGTCMTIEIGTQKVGRIGRRGKTSHTPSHAPSLAIGEADANIFACPACQRPLGSGTPRCPSCGTRLIGGVKASRAAVLVGIGVFTGMIASGALMGVGSVVAPRAADVAGIQPAQSVAPTQVPV